METSNRRPDVLVVHSDPLVVAELASSLRDAGYHVTEAGSYFAARRVLSTELPRLLVADIRLGAYNGLNLAWLRQLTFPGPTVITDAVPDPVLQADAQKLKAVYLAPAPARLVVSWTRELLGSPTSTDRPISTLPDATCRVPVLRSSLR